MEVKVKICIVSTEDLVQISLEMFLSYFIPKEHLKTNFTHVFSITVQFLHFLPFRNTIFAVFGQF